MAWIMTGYNNQDTSEIDSPSQIVNRIEDQLEHITKQKRYEHDDSFYSVLIGIIEPYELGDWFNGRQIPDIHKLVLIAKKLSVDLQYLITGTNVEYIQDDIKKKERNFLQLIIAQMMSIKRTFRSKLISMLETNLTDFSL